MLYCRALVPPHTVKALAEQTRAGKIFTSETKTNTADDAYTLTLGFSVEWQIEDAKAAGEVQFVVVLAVFVFTLPLVLAGWLVSWLAG